MTACVNRKHTKKVAAVVTASLVGALSLGVAPVAAMAEGTGIDMQAIAWNTNASVTKATDGKGGTVSNPTTATFALGSGKYLVPTEVANDFVTTPIDDSFTITYSYGATWGAAGSTLQTPATGSQYYKGLEVTGWYKADGVDQFQITSANQALTADQAAAYFGGTLTDLSGIPVEVATAANYYANISKGSESMQQVFKVKPQSQAESLKVKGTLVYNGTSQTPSFVDAEGNDVTLPTGTTISYTDGAGHAVSVKDAGDYVANFTLDGVAYHVPFTIEKLDLASASVYVPDVEGNSVIYDSATLYSQMLVNNAAASSLNSDITVTKVVTPSGDSKLGNNEMGVYSVTISANDTTENVSGTVTVSFSKLTDSVFGVIKYGRETVDDSGSNDLDIWLEDGESFDASKIYVDGAGTYGDFEGDQLEITYYDNNNHKAVDASALAQKGNYTVTVRVKPYRDFETNAWLGGSQKFTVNVNPTKLETQENLAFFFDGELAGDSVAVTYDGTDQLAKLETVVKDSNGNDLVEGTDYTLEITKGGKKVDSAVDAGTYKIKVKPVTFEFDNTVTVKDEFTITVNKVDAKRLVAATDDMMFTALDNGQIPAMGDDDGIWWTPQVANQFFVAYTGSAIELPGVKYEVANSDGTFTYPELSSDLFNVVSIKKGGKTVKEVKDEGTYTVKIALTDEAAANYQLSEDEYTVTVKSYGHFVDVDSAKWYSVPVEKAYELGYVHGISNTNLFAPEADITRADAVCILFNMAGGDSLHGDDEFSFSEDKGYDTGFNDVDGHAYFAKALAWAHASGVANGSNGDFRPYDKITREEFASLLANFAKNKGDFTAAADDALDGVSDANTVSDWAEDNVAWAVENGVMGNGGFVAGQSNITRAEVAAMAVNYQPEAL